MLGNKKEMLSDIENFLFGDNVAHDLHSLEKKGMTWVITIAPTGEKTHYRAFVFTNVAQEYEQLLLEEDEVLEYPLPIIGFESRPKENGKWRFLLNAGDVEWAFTANWPKKA